MYKANINSTKKKTFIIFISIFLSILFFDIIFDKKNKKIIEAVIDNETEFVNEKINGKFVICDVKIELSNCLNQDINENILFLGNSQLSGINQIKNNDYLTSHYLIKKFKRENKNFITFALPNGSITEFLILSEYVSAKTKIDKIIISLVFDDLREGKIRSDLKTIFDDKKFKKKFNKNQHRKKILKKIAKPKNVVKKHESEENIQDFVEEKINIFLNNCCDYETKKLYATSRIYHNLYLLRNYVFNINPTTKRKIILPFYQDNIESLKEIIKLSKDKKIDLFFYIAPIRNDIKLPYDLNEYNSFIKYSEQISENHDVNFRNFEKIIPNNLWGTKPGTSIGRDNEVDFMHFQGPAHKILSNFIYKFLKSNDF